MANKRQKESLGGTTPQILPNLSSRCFPSVAALTTSMAAYGVEGTHTTVSLGAYLCTGRYINVCTHLVVCVFVDQTALHCP